MEGNQVINFEKTLYILRVSSKVLKILTLWSFGVLLIVLSFRIASYLGFNGFMSALCTIALTVSVFITWGSTEDFVKVYNRLMKEDK